MVLFFIYLLLLSLRGEKGMKTRKMVFLIHTLQTLISFGKSQSTLGFVINNWKTNLLAGYKMQEQNNVYLYPVINIFVVGSWEGGLQSWIICFIPQN